MKIIFLKKLIKTNKNKNKLKLNYINKVGTCRIPRFPHLVTI